jgi:hypothetical protein
VHGERAASSCVGLWGLRGRVGGSPGPGVAQLLWLAMIGASLEKCASLMNRRWGASFSRRTEWDGYMSFEERLGHIYIYVYRLDRDLSWARAKLTK